MRRQSLLTLVNVKYFETYMEKLASVRQLNIKWNFVPYFGRSGALRTTPALRSEATYSKQRLMRRASLENKYGLSSGAEMARVPWPFRHKTGVKAPRKCISAMCERTVQVIDELTTQVHYFLFAGYSFRHKFINDCYFYLTWLLFFLAGNDFRRKLITDCFWK